MSFIRANLTGADFSGATFVDTGNPGRSSDFSFARLDSACFIGAKFQAPTYFTYATLTSVDFSQTDLSNGNAIFGDQPLKFDAAATRSAELSRHDHELRVRREVEPARPDRREHRRVPGPAEAGS